MMKSKIKWVLLTLQVLYLQVSFSQDSLDEIINSHQQEYEQLAIKIWDLAEVGYQEYKSSDLLQQSLKTVSYTHLTLPTNREV